MPKNKNSRVRHSPIEDIAAPIRGSFSSAAKEYNRIERPIPSFIKHYRVQIGAVAFCLLIGLGVFASNGWLPDTDGLTGQRTGWFGAALPKNAPSSWNPFAVPPPPPTPSLSKEMVYAGSRLLTVEDKNANAAPPTDLAVWRPGTGVWYVLGAAQTIYPFGANGDKPAPGDYDGDGKTDFAVFRPSEGVWYVVKSSDSTFLIQQFGVATDVPAAGDFDGDAKTDIAVWRSGANASWHILPSSTGAFYQVPFGTTNDVPTAADFDGDGVDDLSVWRGSANTFYVVNSSNGQLQVGVIGADGDIPVCGDYDGDGKADFGVFRAGNGTWYRRSSATGQPLANFQYGQAGDVPVPNDYDADGKVDVAVFRISSKGEAFWYIRKTSTGLDRIEQWGLAGDIPVPAYFRR
jgi:hypothetical protein